MYWTHADAQYVRWLVARDTGEDIQASCIFLFVHNNRLRANLGDYRSIELPGPDPMDWQRRVDDARARAGLDCARTKRDSIKANGITIPKRWNWTKHREWEERDTVRQMFARPRYIPLAMTRFADEKDGARRTP